MATIKHTQIEAKLNSADYNEFFADIYVSIVNGMSTVTDGTLESTARMLLMNRLTSYKGSNGRKMAVYINVGRTAQTIKTSYMSNLCDALGRYNHTKNLMIWYYAATYEDLKNKWDETLTKYKEENNNSDEYKYNELMSRWLNAVVIDSSHTTTVFLPVMSIRKEKGLETFHRLVAGLAQFEIFKPFFADDKALTAEELAMLQSLTEDGAGWIEYEKQFMKDTDFDRLRIETMTANFATNRFAQIIQNHERRIRQLSEEIDSYRDRITDRIEEMQNTQALHMAAIEREKTAPDTNKTIADFFLNNRNVVPIRRDGGHIYFVTKATCSLYDEDMIESYINNRNSLLYSFRDYEDKVSHDVAKMFYQKVFVNREYRLDFIAKWRLQSNVRIDSISETTYPDNLRNHAMPNPHVHYFNCLGSHRSMFSQAEQDIDFEQAMLVSIQSTASLNWGDGTVVRRFVEALWSESKKVFYHEATGEYVTRATILKNIMKELNNEEAQA